MALRGGGDQNILYFGLQKREKRERREKKKRKKKKKRKRRRRASKAKFRYGTTWNSKVLYEFPCLYSY